MLGGLFTGKNSWIMYVMNFMTLVFFVAFIFCVVNFFDTTETNELIKWTAGGMISLLAVSMLKMFAWLQMDKNALLREIKRLELQVSSLASKL